MKTTTLLGNFRLQTSLASLALLAILGMTAHAAVIETVPVGNTGNTGEVQSQGTFGAVDYNYRIGKYEVTNGQYREFLNAKAKTDPHGLYNSGTYGIARIGISGNYTYTARGNDAAWDNRPVNYVSFWDAARFANWMHNGMGDGDTETGAYRNIGDQTTFARNADAKWFLPTENEWYKAAYHKNDGDTGNYFDYATSSDSTPSNDLAAIDPGNNANFYQNGHTLGGPYYSTEVGEFENSASPYGTYDQNGNMREWNETAIGSWRGLRGGGWGAYSYYLPASYRYNYPPAYEGGYIGFRVASIPEPGSITLVVCGLGVLLLRRRGRK